MPEEQTGIGKPELITLASKIELGSIGKPTESTVRSLLGQYERYEMILGGKISSEDSTLGDPIVKTAKLEARESQLHQVLSVLGFGEQVKAIRLAHRGSHLASIIP